MYVHVLNSGHEPNNTGHLTKHIKLYYVGNQLEVDKGKLTTVANF